MAGRKLTTAEAELMAVLEQEAETTREMARLGGWVVGSVQQLVLTLGRWFAGPAESGRTDPTFSGPATQARASANFVYVEGYVLTAGEAHLKAWCASVAGEVLYGNAGKAYLGIPMREEFRQATVRRTHQAGVLIGLEYDNFRLLRRGFPAGAVLDAGYQGPL